jgi:4-amino-4-deoxy-L-arabinose transferase-like glycosyltransferase
MDRPVTPRESDGREDSNLGPIDVAGAGVGSSADAARERRLIWFFIALGFVLRTALFLANHPLWGDEAYLAANFIDRGFGDFFKPLDYHQVCPLLFLWVELAAVKLLGFSEYSLRLFPTICSIAALFLFRHVAGRVLRGTPLVIAVGILAVAFYPIRHGAEVKPYASDLLVALGFLAFAIEWWRSPRDSRWLWLLGAFTPLGLALSLPAVFVAGGISLALAIRVWSTRNWSSRLAFAMFHVALVATFVILYATVIQKQHESTYVGMRRYWVDAFPPLQNPVALVVWLLRVHTSHMFSYPLGGERGASVATTLCVMIAAWALWRRGQKTLLAILFAPFGLGLIAAFLGRYPYGGSARVMQYGAPAICLTAGLGAAVLMSLRRRPEARRRLVWIAMFALFLAGSVPIGREVIFPYKTLRDHRAREFARWFWIAKGRDAELACVKRDLGTIFEQDHWDRGRTAVYLCNQKIYSPRHRRGESLPWDKVSAQRPLRCVLYNEEPCDVPKFEAWMRKMGLEFDRRSVERFEPVPKVLIKDVWFEDRYIVYEFVPKAGGSPVNVARKSDGRGRRG